MKRIDSPEQLRTERKRLHLRKKYLEIEIKRDFKEIKAGLEPAKLISEGAKKALASSENRLLGNSVGEVANLIAKTSLKHSGFLPRLIVPFLITNVTGNLVEKNKYQIMNWLTGIAARLTGKKTIHEQAR